MPPLSSWRGDPRAPTHRGRARLARAPVLSRVRLPRDSSLRPGLTAGRSLDTCHPLLLNPMGNRPHDQGTCSQELGVQSAP